MLRHHIEIILKLVNEVLHFWIFDLDDKWIRELSVLSTYYEIICLWNEHLYWVNAIAKVMLSRVESLLFHNLIAVHLGGIWVALFLVVKSGTSARTFYFLFYDEIRLSHETILALERVLTNIFQNFFARVFIFLPLRDVITCLFILKSFQNELIFPCDLGEFSFSCLSIQRSAPTGSSRSRHKGLNGHFCSSLTHEIGSLLNTSTSI